MKGTPKERGVIKSKKDYEFNSVFSEIKWEDFIERMVFSGKMEKGAQRISKSITIEAKELRLCEIITEAWPHYQCLSDTIRDSFKKGIMINYEILVRRKGKIKMKGEATYKELAFIDEELAIIAHIEMVQSRIISILKEGKKNIAGRDEVWAEETIEHLIETADSDYPNKGIKEHFKKLLYEPKGSDALLFNIKNSKKVSNFE